MKNTKLELLLEETKTISEKVAKVHGSHHIELIEIYNLIKDLYLKDFSRDLFGILRKYSDNYTFPIDACKSYKALYNNLKDLDNNLNN